jgi:hypothetical protein
MSDLNETTKMEEELVPLPVPAPEESIYKGLVGTKSRSTEKNDGMNKESKHEECKNENELWSEKADNFKQKCENENRSSSEKPNQRKENRKRSRSPMTKYYPAPEESKRKSEKDSSS